MSIRDALRALVAVTLLSLAGCADNAILEVGLELPAATPEHTWVHVHARFTESGEGAFAEPQWAGPDEQQASIALLERPERTQVSVVAPAKRDDDVLSLRLSFCPAESCPTPSRHEIQIQFERAFYVGKRTWWESGLLTIPDADMPEYRRVPKCDVGGCRDNSDGLIYCDGDDGLHYCE